KAVTKQKSCKNEKKVLITKRHVFGNFNVSTSLHFITSLSLFTAFLKTQSTGCEEGFSNEPKQKTEQTHNFQEHQKNIMDTQRTFLECVNVSRTFLKRYGSL
ncbi:MAG: hypothetical protein ABW098_20000, partial [Candidatus Thiodiazotropha sp.]